MRNDAKARVGRGKQISDRGESVTASLALTSLGYDDIDYTRKARGAYDTSPVYHNYRFVRATAKPFPIYLFLFRRHAKTPYAKTTQNIKQMTTHPKHFPHDKVYLGCGNLSSNCIRTPTFMLISSCTSSFAPYGIVICVTWLVLLHVWQ